MRIGKFVEHIRAGSELYDAAMRRGTGDKIVQYLQTLRQIGYAGYMFFDTMTILDAMGVRKYEKAKRVQASAYRCWFLGLLASTLAGIYSLYALNQRTTQIDEKDADGKVERVKMAKYENRDLQRPRYNLLTDVDRQAQTLRVQLTSDLCDIMVPSTALGYTKLDDGIIGLAGTLSSLLGVRGVWAKTA